MAPIHSYIARQLRDQAARDLAAAEAEAANWPLPGQSVHVVPDFFATDDEAERVANAAAPAIFPTCTICKAEANVFLSSGNLCWDHLKEKAEAEAEKDEVRDLFEDKDHDDIFGFVPVRRERVKEEW